MFSKKSFARDNLAYVVLREEGKLEKLLDILKKVSGAGVVYVRNRRRTKEIALFLQRRGCRLITTMPGSVRSSGRPGRMHGSRIKQELSYPQMLLAWGSINPMSG
jgi:superfamily II DNA/RNA helicase